MKNILIDDISLRDAKSNSLSFKEKLEIAKNLSELGVSAIELSAVNCDKTDEVLVKTICSCVTKPIIACQCGNSVEQVEKAYSLIKQAKNKRLIVSIPVSSIQMEYFVSKKPVAVLELLGELLKKAKSLCGDVEVVFEDSTRAESDFLIKAIETAINCGVDKFCFTDLTGRVMPNAFADFIKSLYDGVEVLKKKDIAISVSDELSLGIADMLSAIPMGINRIKISALNFGGLASLTKTVSAMDNVGGSLGFNLSINKTAVKRITDRISNFGKGNENGDEKGKEVARKNLGANLTKAKLTAEIKKLGYDLMQDDIDKVYSEYLRLSEKKEVNTKELDVIIATSAMQVKETYSLVSYSVQSSNVLTATASIVLKKGEETVSGLSYGNGSVDAAFLALENICGRHFELDDYELGAVTEGKEAIGQAIVKLRDNGKIYSGRGVSTDIVGASIRAYISALNKIVYEENN